MNRGIHVLNGDALYHRLQSHIDTELIILREVLMEGPLEMSSQEAFYNARQRFFESYFHVSPKDYEEKSVHQLEKLEHISDDSLVYLWFEDDVFCQINMWYCINRLKHHQGEIRWVRSARETPYSFYHTGDLELLDLLEHSTLIPSIDLKIFSHLFLAYARNDFKEIESISSTLSESYRATIKAVIEAEENRKLDANSKVNQTLRSLKKDYPNSSFEEIFAAFQEQLPIYGMGDLQVQKLWDEN